MKSKVNECIEWLNKDSDSGKLDEYMFSLQEVQSYLCREVGGSSFKIFRKVCLGYLKEEYGVILSREEVKMLFSQLPDSFVSVGAYVLRKERNNY